MVEDEGDENLDLADEVEAEEEELEENIENELATKNLEDKQVSV